MRSGKIIRREDANILLDAARVLAEAQAEAARVLDTTLRQANEQADALRHDTAQAAAQERSHLMLQAVASRDAYMAEVESELVGVVINAVRSIFSQYTDHERAVLAVGKALRALRQQTQATLHVHPSHYEALCAAVPDLLRDTPPLQSLVVERDSRLKPGTSVLSSAMGLVETDLESQLRAIENALLRHVKTSEAARTKAAGRPT